MEFDEETKGRKTDAMIAILRTLVPKKPQDVLVVGCGSGIEAGDLARAFDASTFGIDIGNEFIFDHAAAAPAKLVVMDAQALRFADASFDLVYSFHALEHIPDPKRALAEMARVLRSGGTYLIGTPNKCRLLGYFGSPTSLKNKLKWNLKDLGMRLAGRWRNDAGAHAGFAEKELRGLCASAFGGETEAVSDRYYRKLYPRKIRAVNIVAATGLKNILYPCVYVSGRRSLP